jgi:hypothetical protein
MTQLERAVESTWALVITRFGVPVLLVVLGGLGAFAWGDIRSTLNAVRLIQFQQIKDGKDIERHSTDIQELRMDLREIEQRLRAKGISDVQPIYEGRANDF